MAIHKRIGEVKQELQAAEETMLPSFIEAYREDGRAGVQKLVQQAQKKLEALRQERERVEAMKAYEKKYASMAYICGIDEAGRGPLAGPVVAGAVILPKDCQILYLDDQSV